MGKSSSKPFLNGGTAMILLASTLAAMPVQAHAQAQPQPAPSLPICSDGQTTDCVPNAPAETAPASSGGDLFVVTGSRIRTPNLTSNLPVASIGGESILKQAQTNVGEALNNMPQLRSSFSQQNPGAGIGIAGLNLLDLRGLGTQRTLVLVNGRRHVPADVLNNAVSPDVNTIPNDLLERVDIVTGGNSAIYGSDAIAGVVNFVLRRDYNGAQLRASASVAEPGFGASKYISGMVGRNFGDGKGNVTLHAEYSTLRRTFGSDNPSFRRVDGFGTVDVDTSLANNSDGIPDSVFFRDFRTASVHRFGLIPITQRTGNPVCGQALVPTNGAPSTSGGSSFNCTYIFDDAGNMVPQTGTRFGTGIIGSIIGGNGQTGREGQLLSIIPQQKRTNINLLTHYALSDSAELFFEGKWNRTNARGSNAGPSFIQGTLTQFDYRERTRLDNPFLTPTQRTTLANAILASGCNTSLSTPCGAAGNLTAAQRTQIANGTYRFVVARQLADAGLRDEDFQRDTYRLVGGLRGQFNTDWSYEISANYGKFREDTTTNGYLDRQRFSLAMDAGLNPVTGQIQCRAQFDPASAVALQRDFTGQEALQAALQQKLAADIAACVPYNPFGAADNRAAVSYFSYNGRHKASLDQLVLNGFISGDTSGFFNMPGGPVRFAVGAEYRREKSYYKQDPYVEAGFTNGVVIPLFNPKAFEVKEAFGELQVPILSDRPFFRQLSLNGAARVAKYPGSTGTVWAYNGGIEWSPVNDLRFRGNYGRAVRAPNVSETGFPLVPNFANAFGDPCSPARINAGSGTRAANCQADLGPLLGNITDTAYSLPVLSGSNPDLKAETSDSWTAGFVYQPSFIKGLALTVDYYKIQVKDIISSLSAQTIANSCYDQSSLDNPFCKLFKRYRGTGPGALGENPGQIQGNTLLQAPLNFAKRIREGVDTQLKYRRRLSEDWDLSTDLIYSHNFKISNYENPTLPKFENRILSELGDPQDEFRWDTDIGYKDFTFGYRMHYIAPMYTTTYESFNALPSACNNGSCPPTNADAFDIKTFPAVFYHDVRFEWDLKKDGKKAGFQFYAGVDNLLNTLPPLGSTATGSGSAIYNATGRAYYVGTRARF